MQRSQNRAPGDRTSILLTHVEDSNLELEPSSVDSKTYQEKCRAETQGTWDLNLRRQSWASWKLGASNSIWVSHISVRNPLLRPLPTASQDSHQQEAGVRNVVRTWTQPLEGCSPHQTFSLSKRRPLPRAHSFCGSGTPSAILSSCVNMKGPLAEFKRQLSTGALWVKL